MIRNKINSTPSTFILFNYQAFSVNAFLNAIFLLTV